MGDYFQLQGPITVSAAQVQSLRSAVDIGKYRRLIITRRVTVVATAGSVILQHAATYDEAAFVDYATGPLPLTVAGSDVWEYTDLLRYVRWKVPSITGTAQFMLDVVAKEA